FRVFFRVLRVPLIEHFLNIILVKFELITIVVHSHEVFYKIICKTESGKASIGNIFYICIIKDEVQRLFASSVAGADMPRFGVGLHPVSGAIVDKDTRIHKKFYGILTFDCGGILFFVISITKICPRNFSIMSFKEFLEYMSSGINTNPIIV